MPRSATAVNSGVTSSSSTEHLSSPSVANSCCWPSTMTVRFVGKAWATPVAMSRSVMPNTKRSCTGLLSAVRDRASEHHGSGDADAQAPLLGRMPPSQVISALDQLMSASMAPRTRACRELSPLARHPLVAAGAASFAGAPAASKVAAIRAATRAAWQRLHGLQSAHHMHSLCSARAVTLSPMQLIEVSPVIPVALARLPELAANLSYSWHRPTRALFEDLDQALWRQTHSNPRLMLRCVSQAALDARRGRSRLPAPLRRRAG